MRLSRWFSNLRFPESVIRRAISVIGAMPEMKGPGERYISTASSKGDEWEFDNLEDFFAAFPTAERAYLVYHTPTKGDHETCALRYHLTESGSSVEVEFQKLHQINSVM